jgi:hypothetical protein
MEGCSECAAIDAERGRSTQICYPSHEGARKCCARNGSLEKCSKEYEKGNAKFVGWGSHFIQYTKKK